MSARCVGETLAADTLLRVGVTRLLRAAMTRLPRWNGGRLPERAALGERLADPPSLERLTAAAGAGHGRAAGADGLGRRLPDPSGDGPPVSP
ncbi:hypothetical protein [Streptomyces sp. NPDC003006]